MIFFQFMAFSFSLKFKVSNLACKASLVGMNSFHLCLEKFSLSGTCLASQCRGHAQLRSRAGVQYALSQAPSSRPVLSDDLAGQSTLHCRFFPFSTLRRSGQSLLACKVSAEMCTILFFLVVFKIFLCFCCSAVLFLFTLSVPRISQI